MANWQTSVLKAGTALFTNEFLAKGEWRNEDAAALILAMKASESNPNLADIRTSASRTVSAYMPVRGANGTATARSATHTGTKGTTAAVTPSWSTLAETFSITKKLADNNEYAAAQMFATEMKRAVLSLIARSNAAFVTALVADKNGLARSGANGAFNATDDVFEVEKAYGDRFFHEIQAFMMKNKFSGPVDVLCDAEAFTRAEYLINQGAGNAANYAYQFRNLNLVGTTSSILSGYDGSAMVMPSGSVAYIPWVPLLNRKELNAMKIEDYVGDFGQISIPELGVNIAVHAYSQRADTSAIGGDVQDVTTEFELSIDWAYLSSPMSGTDESIPNAIGLIA